MASTATLPDALSDIDAAFYQLLAGLQAMSTPPRRRPSAVTWRSTPAAPIRNVDLLRRALEYVTEHPDQHDQTVWARRTPTGVVGCLAYHIIRLAGHAENWSPKWVDPDADGVRDHTGYVHAATPCGARHMHDVARDELGASFDQACRLFYPGNSLDKLWLLAEQFTDGQITREANA